MKAFPVLGYVIALTAMATLTFTVYVATGGLLNLRRVFTVLSLVDVVRYNAISNFNSGLFALLEGMVAGSRLQVSSSLRYSGYTVPMKVSTVNVLSDIHVSCYQPL